MATASTTSTLRRRLTEQAVLDLVLAEGQIARPAIADRLGLSKPTVSAVIQTLLAEGLIREAGRAEGGIGRVPTLYSVDSAVGHVGGVDLGGTKIHAAVANIYGEILSEEVGNTDKRGGGHVVRQVATLVRQAATHAHVDPSTLAAVTVATPGVVDPRTSAISLSPNVARWDGTAPYLELRAALGNDVSLDNDVNLAAVGEKWRGLARSVSNYVFVAIGTGIGMGVVMNDELVRGASGAAGEIGYLPIADDPFDPTHHLRGAFENQASGPSLLSVARNRYGLKAAGSVQELFRLAADGHEAAQQVVEYEARLIALAIASVVSVVDPELVVLGGSIGANPLLLDPVRAAAVRLIRRAPRIERSALGSTAALHGAVAEAITVARTRLLRRAPARALAGGHSLGVRPEE